MNVSMTFVLACSTAVTVNSRSETSPTLTLRVSVAVSDTSAPDSGSMGLLVQQTLADGFGLLPADAL